MPGPVLVGYDDSDGSRAALECAIGLAAGTGVALIIVYGYGPPGSLGDEYRAHMSALQEEGRRATDQALELVSASGVEADVELVEEKPVDALLGFARTRDASFIVVGGYGESPIKGAILGSTPHKLLHLADRPVVVVPA